MPTSRQVSWGLGIGPVFLRLVIGATFAWAGLGKLAATSLVQGEQAAALANMGLLDVPKPAAPAPTTAPAKPLPSSASLGGQLPLLAQVDAVSSPSKPQTPSDAGTSGSSGASGASGASTAFPSPSRALPRYSAEDFPDPVSVRRVWMLAYRLHQAGEIPQSTAAGATRSRLLPEFVSTGLWPTSLAIAITVIEIAGGMFVLTGLFTRLSSLALAGIMLGVIWVDQLGPAAQSGQIVLGFIPSWDPWSIEQWRPLLWQLSLLAGSLTLSCTGSGVLAVDRAIAGFRSASSGSSRSPGADGARSPVSSPGAPSALKGRGGRGA